MNRESAIAEWRRAVESMGAARSCQRDGYYAILHAAKAALQLHGVDAESHSAVRRMFGLHLVKTGLVEPEWSAEIGRSEGRCIASDYDAKLHFDEQEARQASDRPLRSQPTRSSPSQSCPSPKSSESQFRHSLPTPQTPLLCALRALCGEPSLSP